jgi:hypothetical protein
MTDRTKELLARLVNIPSDANGESRRREDLIQRVLDAGHPHEYADQIYDVALEENCDPALAIEVVLAGVGVRDLMPAELDSWEETQVEAPPQWIQAPPPADEADRERHMRLTFRRLRSLTEEHGSSQEALKAFVREPDVGDVEY